jgi:glycosyltransferase involved in cell wall biosynthesis
MKICVYHNLSSGGALSLLESQIKALMENGNQVEIITTTQSKNIGLENIKVTKVKLDDYWLKRSRLGALLKYSIGKYVLNNTLKKVGRLINEGGYDAVLVTSCRYFYLPLISKHINPEVNSILYLHEPYRWWYEATIINPWRIEIKNSGIKLIGDFIKHILLTIIQRVSYASEYVDLRGYKRVLTNSLFSRESIIRIYGLDAIPMYPWIDNDFFVVSEQKKPYVIGCSFIHPSKNIEFIIRSIATINEESRPELIWVANDFHENYKLQLNNLSSQLGVRLTIEHAVPRARLRTLMSEAAVFAYAPRLEPFGLAPIEANMAGTYVVAIAEGGVRESISHGQNGDLITNQNERQFAQYLFKYTNDLSEASNAGKKAQEYIRQGSQVAVAKSKFLEVIEGFVK